MQRDAIVAETEMLKIDHLRQQGYTNDQIKGFGLNVDSHTTLANKPESA